MISDKVMDGFEGPDTHTYLLRYAREGRVACESAVTATEWLRVVQ